MPLSRNSEAVKTHGELGFGRHRMAGLALEAIGGEIEPDSISALDAAPVIVSVFFPESLAKNHDFLRIRTFLLNAIMYSRVV